MIRYRINSYAAPNRTEPYAEPMHANHLREVLTYIKETTEKSRSNLIDHAILMAASSWAARMHNISLCSYSFTVRRPLSAAAVEAYELCAELGGVLLEPPNPVGPRWELCLDDRCELCVEDRCDPWRSEPELDVPCTFADRCESAEADASRKPGS